MRDVGDNGGCEWWREAVKVGDPCFPPASRTKGKGGLKMAMNVIDKGIKTVRGTEMRVYTIDPGNYVFCDWCGEDFTERDDSGGFLFGSKAVCPLCAPKVRALADSYDEGHLIRAVCPKEVSFADWVRGLR